ncbi:MAG: 30S ribosomal protein S6 [Lewinellaceae bacterium]|nr:30S ribosomal protein S6 [Lewinellaceae bacterium]
MRHYEVNFIVNPVLSGDEVKSTAENIQKEITGAGASIVHADEMGLRQLAYAINKRTTGYFYCIEFACESSEWLVKFELNLKRNENLLRFLTVKLDKYGIKYNDDKRKGLIGSRSKKKEAAPPVVAAAAAVAEELEIEAVLAPEVVDLDV